MTHSPLTNQIRLSPQSSPRLGAAVTHVIWHHQAGTNDDAVIQQMVTGRRQVSANYTISSEGRLTCVVDEDLRAWTSGSATDGGKGAAFDRKSITIEVENESIAGWTISAAAYATAARLAADLRSRRGIPLDRDHHVGHGELWTRFGHASYPTACPGGLSIDHLLNLARGAAPAPQPAAAAAAPSAPAFPLPAGSYFGPKSGPAQSVSGYYSHREDFRRWQQRMADRGWAIAADGLYGGQSGDVAEAFQREKGLDVDRLIGPATWAAAWTSPVT
jgi:N-acetyl-anhydromuramyl-L-alanine amidase AmpD